MQLSFLPEINRDETKRNVEDALEQYNIMVLMDPEELEPKVTASFQLTPPSVTNEFSSSTEDVAIERVEMEQKRRNYIRKIQRAVNRLSYHEREVIIRRYLGGEEVYDYQTYNELGFSESKYYRIKSDAFYKMAFMLRLAVYEEVETQ